MNNPINSIYVLGGHKLSSDYITKLKRAQQEGLITFNDIFYVDETPGGWVQKEHLEVSQIIKPYADFLAEYIPAHCHPRDPKGAVSRGGDPSSQTWIPASAGMTGLDILVPDHTAPHVLFQLFIKLAEQNNIKVEIKKFETNLNLPFQKTFDSGVCAISYATWICPIDCDEPSFCPGKNDKRDWDFETYLSGIFPPLEKGGPAKQGGIFQTAHIFNCPQLAYGVVGIPVQDIASEWMRLLAQLNHTSPILSIIGTHTKCHGIIGQAQFGL